MKRKLNFYSLNINDSVLDERRRNETKYAKIHNQRSLKLHTDTHAETERESENSVLYK